MTPIESKRLIATFMNYAGGKPLTDELLLTLYNDWNSLAPVLKKIRALDVDLSSWRMIKHPLDYDIERVSNQLAEFVQWYVKNN